MADIDQATTKLRTPGQLAIKTVATHLFAIGNYAYMSTLQQRPTRTGLHALRIVLFAFLPTVVIIELSSNLIRALIQFVRNQIDEDEDEKNIWFHLSAGSGKHASMFVKSSATDKDHIRRVSLLSLDPTLVERERVPWSWVWAGKLFATLFAMTQAIGTIVMYARRLDRGHELCLGFDHRNGAMGIASTICSVASIFLLLLPFEWKVARALQPPGESQNSELRTTLIVHTFLAMLVHIMITCAVGWDNEWLYTSAGLAAQFFGITRQPSLAWGWQSVLLVVFIFNFRHEIAARVGLDSGRYQTWIRHRSWRRVKALLLACLVGWIVADIGVLFVLDIVNAIRHRGYHAYLYWWQDPMSDNLFIV